MKLYRHCSYALSWFLAVVIPSAVINLVVGVFNMYLEMQYRIDFNELFDLNAWKLEVLMYFVLTAVTCVVVILAIDGVASNLNVQDKIYPIWAVIVGQAVAIALYFLTFMHSGYNRYMNYHTFMVYDFICKHFIGVITLENTEAWVLGLTGVQVAIYTAAALIIYFRVRRKRIRRWEAAMRHLQEENTEKATD